MYYKNLTLKSNQNHTYTETIAPVAQLDRATVSLNRRSDVQVVSGALIYTAERVVGELAMCICPLTFRLLSGFKSLCYLTQ